MSHPNITVALSLDADGYVRAVTIARITSSPSYHQALAAGLNRRQAWRWVLYLELKATQSQQPITLDEAVQQCADAAAEAA